MNWAAVQSKKIRVAMGCTWAAGLGWSYRSWNTWKRNSASPASAIRMQFFGIACIRSTTGGRPISAHASWRAIERVKCRLLFPETHFFQEFCKDFIFLGDKFSHLFAVAVDNGETEGPHPFDKAWLLHRLSKGRLQFIDNRLGQGLWTNHIDKHRGRDIIADIS